MSLASVDAGTELDELVVAAAEPGTVVLVATVIDVVVLDVATVLVVELATGTVIGTATPAGAAFQLAIVNEPQSLLSKLLIRPNSLWSIDKPQRALTDIQSPR